MITLRRRYIPAVALLTIAALSSACGQEISPEQASRIRASVARFAQTVATGVTQRGPSAWRDYLSDSPSFFMVSDGRLVFANGAAATAGIGELGNAIKQIELRWGDDLRVDPLTRNLAVLATSYYESRTSVAGQRVEETGYLTGIVDYRSGRWQFRNAHWSVAGPRPSVP